MSTHEFRRALTRVNSAAAFAGGFLTAAALAWTVVGVSAQGDPGIHVCVAADGTMRMASSATCGSGQQSVYFQKPSASVSAPKPTPDSAACQSQIDQAKLDVLERHVRELEDADKGGELANHVVAPFEVTDRAGKRLFSVDEQGGSVSAQVYNVSGEMAASIVGLPSGGQFTARSQGRATYLGVFGGGTNAGLQVWDGGNPRLTVGKDDKGGHYVLKVLAAGGKAVAAIGENSVGTGTAQVADASGNVKAMLTVDKDKGKAAILGPQSNEVAYLTQGAAGGGLLRILDAAGASYMVEAGITEGVGIVRAGPAGFKPGLGVLGLPGSYIMGSR